MKAKMCLTNFGLIKQFDLVLAIVFVDTETVGDIHEQRSEHFPYGKQWKWTSDM